jgi:hypothetical protein
LYVSLIQEFYFLPSCGSAPFPSGRANEVLASDSYTRAMPDSLSARASEHADDASPALWLTLLLSAAAGGMGWGIRGQYGHETGAMIAGLLVALVIGLLFCRGRTSLFAARVAALTAIGIGFGGAMTYGQAVGLSHDPQFIGNWEALRWGMLGLAVIGGIWVGFAGVLMGMGLGGKRYRSLEIALLFMFLIGLHFLGLYLLNEPFEPDARRLPRIYFSGDWYWQPDNDELQPRPECWGGLLFALLGLWAYAAFWKRDVMARNVGLFGVLFGAIGFPAGQSVQAYHSWNRADFQVGWLASIEPYMNWWNAMETIFGAILGLGLGLGVWLNRRRIVPLAEDDVEIPLRAEAPLLIAYAAAIAAWNFISFPPLDAVANNSLTMGLLPLTLIFGGRYSAYVIALPIVALPICGKTLRELSYESGEMTLATGWTLLFVLPMLLSSAAAIILARRGLRGADGQSFARWALVLASWLYFTLNLGFFRAPAWPFGEPTPRTPSTLVFSVCLLIITLACVGVNSRRMQRM